MTNVEIDWERPYAPTWRNGLSLDQVKDAILDRVEVHPAAVSTASPIVLKNVEGLIGMK
jgi:hypothetical protein